MSYVVVNIAVDSWSGTDVTGSLIGAWSATRDGLAGATPADILDRIRAALGDAYRPATAEEVMEWHKAFQARADVPWEQISLF